MGHRLAFVLVGLGAFALGCNATSRSSTATHATQTEGAVATLAQGLGPATEDPLDMPASCVGRGPGEECFELHPNAVRLDALEHSRIIRDIEVLPDLLIFHLEATGSAPPLPVLQPGRAIFGGRHHRKPFLRKILSVVRRPSVIVVRTEPASLHDAFRKLRIRRKVPVALPLPSQQLTRSTEKSASSDGRSEIDLAHVKCDKSLVDDSGLYIGMPTCSFTPKLLIDAEISLSDGDTETFRLGAGFGLDVDLDFLISLDKHYNAEKTVALVPRVDIPIVSIGVLSVGVAFGVDTGYKASFDVKASVSASYRWSGEVVAGVRFIDGGLSPYVEKSAAGQLDGPYIDFNGAATAELFIKPYAGVYADASILVAGAGASLTIGAKAFAYAKLEAHGGCRNQESTDGPLATTGIGYELGVGVRGGITATADLQFLFWKKEASVEWEFGEQRWPFVVDTLSLPIGQCCDLAGCPDVDRCTVATACEGNQCSYRTLSGDCCRNDSDCDDRNDCTTDKCEPSGECTHKLKPRCVCAKNADCADGEACTEDRCRFSGTCNWSHKTGCRRCSRDSDCALPGAREQRRARPCRLRSRWSSLALLVCDHRRIARREWGALSVVSRGRAAGSRCALPQHTTHPHTRKLDVRGRRDKLVQLNVSRRQWYSARFAQFGGSMALIDNPDAARRLARAIASDVSLYNEEKIVQGITNDNLFETLHGEIEEGRELYKSRIAPELYGSTNFYDRAIVDILVRSKGHIKSKIW